MEERKGGKGPVIATYSRNSKGKLGGASIPAQEAEQEPVIKKLDPPRVLRYIDEGISGTDFRTRQILDILARKEAGELSIVVCSNIDRLGRDALGLMGFVYHFSQGGEGFIATPERTYDCTKPEDMVDILDRISSAARELISRTKSTRIAIKQRADRGEYPKRVPFGYIRMPDGSIRIIPELVKIVRNIYKLYRKTGNLNHVCRVIMKRYSRLLKAIKKKYPQIRNNLNISDDRIRTILTDPVFAGKPVFLGETYIRPAYRIISDKEAKACQEKLRKKDSKRRLPSERPIIKWLKTKPTITMNCLDILDTSRLPCVHCGGILNFNGNDCRNACDQSLIRCPKCTAEVRRPTTEQYRRLQENVVCSKCNGEISEQIAPVVCRNCIAELIPRQDFMPDQINIGSASHVKQIAEQGNRSKSKSKTKIQNQAKARTNRVIKICTECREKQTKGHYSNRLKGIHKWFCIDCYSMLYMRKYNKISAKSFRGRYRRKG